MSLANVIESSAKCSTTLRWPTRSEIESRALSMDVDGPETILPLERQLGQYSQLIRGGVPVIQSEDFTSLAVPILDRTLEADFGDSPDIGNNGVTVAKASPKRLSAFIVVSDLLRQQNPLFVARFIEAQLLAALARKLDKVALIGDGVGDNPTGILEDTDVPTRDRATAGTDTLADLVGMQRAIADAEGEDSAEDFLWISSPDVRESLQTTEGIGSPIWTGPGPLGHRGTASTLAPAGTLILAQQSAMAFIDYNQVKVENLLDVQQAKAGFRTLFISGWFDFAILDTNALIVATDPA